MVQKIKGGCLDPEFLADGKSIIDNAKLLKMNMINVPIQIDYPTPTTNNPTINEARFEIAKDLVRLAHKNGIRVMVQNFTYISGGDLGETSLNPSNKQTWFRNIKEISMRIIEELLVPENVWAYTVANNLHSMEYNVNSQSNPYPYASNWADLFKSVKDAYGGNVIYRTNWWWDDTHRDLKINNPFWEYIDFVAIDTWFELTPPTLMVPTAEQIASSIYQSMYDGRRIYDDILALHQSTGLPIFFGGFGCPSVEAGTYQPWDYAPAGTYNEDVQANFYEGYRRVFEKEDWWMGFALWTINSEDNYQVVGKKAEDAVKKFLGDNTPNTLKAPEVTRLHDQVEIPLDAEEGDEWFNPHTGEKKFLSHGSWVNMGVEVDNDVLELDIDMNLSDDSYVSKRWPDSNFYGEDTLYVASYVDGGEINPHRIVIKPNLTDIPENIHIVGARLELYNLTDYSGDIPITAYALESAFNKEEVTFNTLPLEGNAIDKVIVTENIGWFSWDITQLVVDWKTSNGQVPYHGFVLRAAHSVENQDKTYKYFSSSSYNDINLRPRVKIYYKEKMPRIKLFTGNDKPVILEREEKVLYLWLKG